MFRAGESDNPFPWTVFYQMNHCEPPHPRAAVRQAVICLSLGLLPVLAPHRVDAKPLLRPLFAVVSPASVSAPYLPAIGAPQLRFAEAALPPERSPQSAPVVAAVTPPSVATAPAESVPVAESAPATSAALNAHGDETRAAPNPDRAKDPEPILRDDVRPVVKPEDFLPYFQIPGSARKPADVTLLVPAPNAPPTPGSVPPSSATYTQSPK